MSLTPPTNLGEDDYEAIEGAVMETVRGRWFLLEFARRQRASQMDEMLAILRRMERQSAPFHAELAPAPEPIQREVGAQRINIQAPSPLHDFQGNGARGPVERFVRPASALEALDALPVMEKIAFFA
ncbi:MAG: hypothetical protein KGQ46_10320 [Hyphomicrobiales bacterium]|nr:hypothetical protein [Hyphomicrobiales bacterium]MDE2114313.1 hypothetical protein [Hyphomicrobiales bacterium]